MGFVGFIGFIEFIGFIGFFGLIVFCVAYGSRVDLFVTVPQQLAHSPLLVGA